MANQYINVVSATGSHSTSKVDFPLVGLDATTIPKAELAIKNTFLDGGAAQIVYAPFDLEITNIRTVTTTGGAGAPTVQVAVAAGNIMTAALAISTSAGGIANAATLHPTRRLVSKGAAITITPAQVGGNDACTTYMVVVPQ